MLEDLIRPVVERSVKDYEDFLNATEGKQFLDLLFECAKRDRELGDGMLGRCNMCVSYLFDGSAFIHFPDGSSTVKSVLDFLDSACRVWQQARAGILRLFKTELILPEWNDVSYSIIAVTDRSNRPTRSLEMFDRASAGAKVTCTMQSIKLTPEMLLDIIKGILDSTNWEGTDDRKYVHGEMLNWEKVTGKYFT